MTAVALAGVGILATQAAATAPKVSSNVAAAKSTRAPGTGVARSSAPTTADPTALPAKSGTGLRIVYGVGARRVWLVSSSNTVVRTFPIVPGTIAAPTGAYTVISRLSSETGTDGTPVQYVVLFGRIRYNGSNTALGFDAVANVTGMPPAPGGHTAAVRMAQADAQALWDFSTFGTAVVVVS
jgi:hypothetical protein